MKNLLVLFCALILFTGCSSKKIGENINDKNGTDQKNLNLEILDRKSETPDIDLTVEETINFVLNIKFKNVSKKEYMTGNYWEFFYRENDKSKWKQIYPEGYFVTDVGIIVKSNKEYEEKLNLLDIFKEKDLISGEYKAVKGFMDSKKSDKKVGLIFKVK